ncbi:hypothetical protein LINPERHAP1_LOCUS10500, partial [Linum perenne]
KTQFDPPVRVSFSAKNKSRIVRVRVGLIKPDGGKLVELFVDKTQKEVRQNETTGSPGSELYDVDDEGFRSINFSRTPRLLSTDEEIFWSFNTFSFMSQFMKTALALLSKGNLIHGIANKVSADYFSTSLSLGSVYLLRQFVSPPSVGSYRPCTTPISITLTPSVSFEDVTEDNTNFCRESFEIFQFENLKGHADLQQFLAVDYDRTKYGVTAQQKLILKNTRDLFLEIKLFGDFATILDHSEIMEQNSYSPVVIALGGMSISQFRGSLSLINSSATRIVVNPAIPEAVELTCRFASTPRKISLLPIKYDSPQKAHAHLEASKRTIQQLMDMRASNSSDVSFVLHPCRCFKIRFAVSDETALAHFLLLGKTAENIIPATADDLFRNFPRLDDCLPPELELFLMKEFTFDV